MNTVHFLALERRGPTLIISVLRNVGCFSHEEFQRRVDRSAQAARRPCHPERHRRFPTRRLLRFHRPRNGPPPQPPSPITSGPSGPVQPVVVRRRHHARREVRSALAHRRQPRRCPEDALKAGPYDRSPYLSRSGPVPAAGRMEKGNPAPAPTHHPRATGTATCRTGSEALVPNPVSEGFGERGGPFHGRHVAGAGDLDVLRGWHRGGDCPHLGGR